MNKLKSILFLTAVCALSSCTTTNADIITGIEIAGPYSVLVGKTITLIADVLGTENDDVIWSSENEKIATVSEDGVVLGVSEGLVNIIATSKANAEYSKKYEISVNLPKATGIKLSVEENELIEYKGNDTYDVPLGLSFLVNVDTVPDNTAQPENISVTCKDATGNELQSNAFDVEIESYKQIRVTAFDSMTNVVFIVKATYSDINIDSLVSSLTRPSLPRISVNTPAKITQDIK